MEEKLLTQSQAVEFLGVSGKDFEKMIKEGRIHAYKVGGVFIRFQKKQLEKIKNELESKVEKKEILPDYLDTKKNDYNYTFVEKLKDFIYFYDFYIVAIIIMIILLIFILITIY